MPGNDDHTHLYLDVTKAEAGLRVSSQNVSGYEGGNIIIRCYGASQWCTIRGSCVGRDGGTIERTTVSDDGDALNVTMWQLQKEDRGWYYCSNKDSQMPVYVTVMDAQEIIQFTTNSPSSTTLPAQPPAHTDSWFLWLLILGAMLPIIVCGAVMLIKAKNKRKQRGESSNVYEGMNNQQLPKEILKSDEVACEDLYETMTGNKQNIQGTVKNNEVVCENLYEIMNGINKQKNQDILKSNEVACEDLYVIMTGNKQNIQTATDNKSIYACMVRKEKV
ncbi:hypothetical protein Q8A67_024097 [Cirrhinus molitorella]|uniref:Immunoglobulin domain-containing protein n=1 Tax=Cirrhinus molitorella TaxID=172907 RepID=A0AA88TJV3_9TELE|nr:hypothetical protein Q8A67_024097 [Cirrhinus molitorella]